MLATQPKAGNAGNAGNAAKNVSLRQSCGRLVCRIKVLAVEEEEEEEEEEEKPAPKPAAKKGPTKQFQGTSTESSGPSSVGLALKAVGGAALLGGGFFAVRPRCLKRLPLPS